MSNSRECLECGFLATAAMRDCPKCDSVLSEQTDGSVWTTDVAHNRETVRQALNKVEKTLNQHLREHTQSVRFVVGSGLIRDAVRQRLGQLKAAGKIKRFEFEGRNEGAIVAHLRND